MHRELAERLVERVRKRVAEGDYPTEPALSVEVLEDLVLTLAANSAPEPSTAAMLSLAQALQPVATEAIKATQITKETANDRTSTR